MIHLVTYSDHQMTRSKKLCIQSALKNGVDSFNDWDREGIEQTEFYHFNREILDQPRGSGYWCWKPYIIYEALLRLSENSILIYSDAGVEIVAPVQEIISRMDEDIFFFTNGWKHIEWCKMDVIKGINGESSEYETLKQIQASVIFFRVNKKTKDFVKEWLLYCQFPGFIDDSPSRIPNYPTFAEHRHDQAILTCMAIKHGYTMDHWWPTQYSYHLPRSERDNYPVMFNHHRRRNNEWQ